MRRPVVALGFAALVAAVSAFAADSTTHRYPLPGHGSFALDVPAHWTNELRQPDGGQPPTIVLTQSSGPRFTVLVTPMFQDIFELEPPDAEMLHQHVEALAAGTAEHATQKKLALHEIKGASGAGYYFTAELSSPKPDGFKYVTRGMLGVDKLVVKFIVLSDEGHEKIVDRVLTMLKGARHLQSAKP